MSNFNVVSREITTIHLSGQGTSHFKSSHPYVITFYIGLFEHLSSCSSFAWVQLKHRLHDSARVSLQQLMVAILTSLDPLIQVLFTSSPKRKLTSQHYIKKYSQSPNVNGSSFVIHLSRDFRSHVTWCSTKNFKTLVCSIGKY